MVLMFLLLQGQFRYLFLEMGDGQLFGWDPDMWRGEVLQPGGLSLWLNGFLVQFFHIPLAGTVIAAILMTLTAVSSFLICRVICGDVYPWLFPLFVFPTAFLCLDVVVDSYSFQAVSDFLLVTWIVLACITHLTTSNSFWPGSAAAVVLILATGPVLRLGSIPGSHSFIRAAWISLAIGAAACFGFRYFGLAARASKLSGVLVTVVLSVSVAVPFLSLLEKHRHPRQEQIFQLSYYARNSQWSYITAVCRKMDMNNYMLLNYANLAMNYGGSLLEHWTDYRQDDVQGLCIKSDMTVGCMSLLSMIYYRMGNIAAAQDMAFEANQYRENPFLLEMLVRTNIIFGSYKVAEKYIAKLEKTLFFREWAGNMRRFLSDEGVSSDAELSSKRRGLPQTDAFMVRDRLIDDLMLLLEADVSNAAARDYAIVYLHLSKDALSLLKFVDSFFGTEALPALSPAMQMGLVAATDGDEEYCRSHGVGEDVIAVYGRQKKEVNR